MAIQSTSSPESANLIKEFLQTHYSGVLATADTGATPHAATVYFKADDEFCLTFATKEETQKYKNIERNNQVAFVCYDEAKQTTVQVSGRAEVIEDEEVARTMINTLYEYSSTLSKAALPPIEKLFAGNYKIVRIIPQVIKMAIFLRPDSEGIDMYEIVTFSDQEESKDETIE